MKAPAPKFRRKRQNAASEECASITRRLSRNQKRSKPTIGKYRRGFGVSEQCVIASAQVRLTNDVEGSFQGHALCEWCSRRFEFQAAKFESYAQFCRRSLHGDAQQVVERRSRGSIILWRYAVEVIE
jgi:hypothetical protein